MHAGVVRPAVRKFVRRSFRRTPGMARHNPNRDNRDNRDNRNWRDWRDWRNWRKKEHP